MPHGNHEIDKHGIYQDKPWSQQEKAYAAQVSRLDSDVGALLALLKELKIDEKTIVILSGDNGSSFPPTSPIGKRFDQASNGLRGFKRGLYEGALRQVGKNVEWKAVKNGAKEPIQLFNLLNDPGEKNNIAAEHKAIVEEATALMKASHTPDPNWPLDGPNEKRKKKAK